jgi:PAS domain-containing protein
VHSVTAIAGDGAARAAISLEDVTERKRAQRLLILEHTVARLLADSASAGAGVLAVIQAVCETQGWDCGRYFGLDPSTRMLCCRESWALPGAPIGQFLEESRGMVLRPDAGLTGRVYQSGQPLWVLGDAQDTPVAATALAHEIDRGRTFVLPVMCDGRPIGVLAFFSPGVCEPDYRMLQAVQSIGSQLGRFLQQQQALDALRRTEARSRKLAQLGSDWIWELDNNLQITQLSGASPFGNCEVLGRTLWDLPGVALSDEKWTEHKSQLAAHWSFCDFEFAVVHPDGQTGHFCICGEPLFDEAGAFTGYCGTGVDISRRKRAELASQQRAAGTVAS